MFYDAYRVRGGDAILWRGGRSRKSCPEIGYGAPRRRTIVWVDFEEWLSGR